MVNIIHNLFNAPTSEVQEAASIALGNITVGNPSHFLKDVLQKVKAGTPKVKQLLLNTLREIIMHD
jgi:hypothetical protein